MADATCSRRGEVEDLQQEVMEVESRAMKQEREIVSLKLQLEESKLHHRREVLKLQEEIATLQSESPLVKTVKELYNNDQMLEVRERLEQLKMRNTALQEENLKLGRALERAIIKINSFEADKTRTLLMVRECASLRSELYELESTLARSRQSPTGSDKENMTDSTKMAGQERSRSSSRGKLRGIFKRRSQVSASDKATQEDAQVDTESPTPKAEFQAKCMQL
jgi:hypothetical protein